MNRLYVGDVILGDKVDITDPCYDKDVWCRMTTECVPGTYKGYVDMSDEGEWGNRVAYISIFKDGNVVDIEDMEYIGEIGVDAGLAGFFNNKPDFDDATWNEVCNMISNGDAWAMYSGVFSSSGYGDGCYSVYANDERDAFTIEFISDNDEA